MKLFFYNCDNVNGTSCMLEYGLGVHMEQQLTWKFYAPAFVIHELGFYTIQL